MDKKIVTMTEWKLSIYQQHYNLSGVADNHPQLGRNTYVAYTSSLLNHKLENDILTYETRLNI